MSNEEETARATLWQRSPAGAWRRSILAREIQERGAEPVRQVAIDDVWSALRFRPR